MDPRRTFRDRDTKKVTRIAVALVATWLAACGDSNSGCAKFDGDTGLTAGVCSDGAECQSFARRGCDGENG